MLMTLLGLVADMADGFQTNAEDALFDLTDNYNLHGVAPEITKESSRVRKAGHRRHSSKFKTSHSAVGEDLGRSDVLRCSTFVASYDGVAAGEPVECSILSRS
jgi:hypothetical protein